MNNYQVLSGLMDVCIGDTLGVPVEFSSRNQRTIKRIEN
ncbi:ADP-ribosylglycohydrolase family protein [Okeania sp. SIO3I5]